MGITTAVSSQAANATTSSITLPASVAAGDKLFALAALDFAAGASTNAQGFTELKDEGATDVFAWIGHLTAAGGETACVLTHVTERSNHVGIRIPATEWHGTQAPEITAVGDGSSTAPDPPSITPSWGAETGTIFIVCAMLDDSAGVSVPSAWPTNYSQQVTSTTATSAGSLLVAIRIAASSPENPSAWTVAPTEHWRTYTIAVRGAVGRANRPNPIIQLLPH